MQEILPGIFSWGSSYPDRPWTLNGYAIKLGPETILIDPPAPPEEAWPKLDALKPITRIILTNRDHIRDAELFRARYDARVVASHQEISELAPVAVDEIVGDGDVIAKVLHVISVPGKSPGEIGLHLDATHYPLAREIGGILLLGDAIIGHPPGALGLIPESKLDNATELKRSLCKLLEYDFEVLLLCDGQSVLSGGKRKVAEFLSGSMR